MESNIKNFIQLKNHKDCKDLDINIITYIIDSFEFTEVKKKQKTYSNNKKATLIIKNPKIKLMKDKISNKVNLILNKLSENNLSNLLLEFFQNIKINTNEDFNEFIKTIYIKMLTEINFFKLYLDFFKNVVEVYKRVYSFNISYFYDLIEYKFKYDYFDTNEIEFLKDYDIEEYRLNNLTIIKELVNEKIINDSLIELVSKEILEQNKYYSDIYYWFKNIKLSKDQINIITELINNEIQVRDKILLEDLISEYYLEPKKNKIIFKNKKPTTLENKIETLLNEYILIDKLTDIHNFIDENCIETTDKNKFTEQLLLFYFTKNDEDKILNLIKNLVNDQVLFKSNFSRALLSLSMTRNDFNENKENLLLQVLKQLGITKGLENLMEKHNIEIIV
jgi:hypothetical protein